MAEAVSSTHLMRLSAAHTLPLALDSTPEETTITEGFPDISATLNATSTPAATKMYTDTISLAAGVATIDLTSMVGAAGLAVDFTGLKVQQIQIQATAANTAGLTFSKGASNAYNLFGEDNASSESNEILPGCGIQLFQNDKLEDVDATHAEIDVAGTGTESFSITLVAG